MQGWLRASRQKPAATGALASKVGHDRGDASSQELARAWLLVALRRLDGDAENEARVRLNLCVLEQRTFAAKAEASERPLVDAVFHAEAALDALGARTDANAKAWGAATLELANVQLLLGVDRRDRRGTRVIRRRFNVGVLEASPKRHAWHACEVVPRDDRSSKNEPHRLDNDRDTTPL